MKKDAYYFPHYCNARHDRKIKKIERDLGLEGYGIFFKLLEVLREQADFKYPWEDIDLLASEFGTSEAKIEVVIKKYDLFTFDKEGNFFSPKLIMYLTPYLEKSERAKKANEIRWGKQKQLTISKDTKGIQMDIQMDNKCNPNQNPINQSINQLINKSSQTEKSEEILTTPEELLKIHFDIDDHDFFKFKDKGMTDKVIIGVLNLCKVHGAKSWAYIEKSLEEKLDHGILTTDDWERQMNKKHKKHHEHKETPCPYRYDD